jgi:hypothetical protein
MNKIEKSQQGLCLLCRDFMGDFGKSTKDVTNFTKTSIEEILGENLFFKHFLV